MARVRIVVVCEAELTPIGQVLFLEASAGEANATVSTGAWRRDRIERRDSGKSRGISPQVACRAPSRQWIAHLVRRTRTTVFTRLDVLDTECAKAESDRLCWVAIATLSE